MIDIANLPAGAELTPADFAGTPSPASVTVRRGAGGDQTDRVTLVWDDYTPGSTGAPGIAIANGWLTVIVKANERTGLPEDDAFTFCNLIGESGDASALFAVVNALDLANVRRSLNTDAPITSRVDFNRDGRVNALDLAVVRQNFRHSLTPPPAPTSPARLARVTVEVLSDDDTVPAGTR